MAVRHPGELRWRREEILAGVAPHARRRPRRRAEPRFELRLGRPWAIERVQGKVRTAIVLHFHDRRPRDARHLTGQPGDQIAVIPAVAAANDRRRREGVRETEPRLEVVEVVRTIGLDDRLEAVMIGPDVQCGVVAQTEIQRQLRRDRPVVLHPARIVVLGHRVSEVSVAEVIPPGNGRQCRKVPRRHVIPDGKQRFDVGGNGPVLGVDIPHAIATAERRVDGVQVLRAQLHVVPPTLVERDRQVVAKLVDVGAVVLRRPDVAADREPSERDARVPVHDAIGRLRVVGPVGVVAGLVEVAVEPCLDLVHHPVRHDMRHARKNFVAAALEVLHGRGMAADLCALQLVRVVVGEVVPTHHHPRTR